MRPPQPVSIACVGTLLTWALVSACGSSHGPRDGASTAASDASGASLDAATAGPQDAAVRCPNGSAIPCGCDDGQSGFRYCAEGAPGACECPLVPRPDPAAPRPDGGMPGCTGDPEWCDGGDNDCDGVVDEGEPCPDSAVRSTLPYAGPVYAGAMLEGCSLAPIWPDPSAPVIALPADGCFFASFRPSDNAAFARIAGRTDLQRLESGSWVSVPTPPCFASMRGLGFDGLGRVYYHCDDDTIRRGNGELIGSVDPSLRLNAVLESGRMVAYTSRHFYLLHRDATTISRPRIEQWVGELEAIGGSATVLGDAAFVAYNRVYRGRTRAEIVVFRVDGESGEWSLVRRAPVPHVINPPVLALPSGSVVFLTTGSSTEGTSVFELPPDGPMQTIRTDRSADPDIGYAPGVFPSYGR